MAVNIRDDELNKNDMTHDELYFTKHLHEHSQKKTLSHTQTNKQQQQQPTKGVTVYCACVKSYKQ